MSERVTIRDPAQAPLLQRFHDELYVPAFAPRQREALATWHARLFAPAPPYQLAIVLAGAELDDAAGARLDGGIVCERYPASGCAILTYLVVAPAARRRGLARGLLDGARAELAGARALFAEVIDPRRCPPAEADEAWARLGRFQRWGARVVDHPYVQPRLVGGEPRDRGLVLIAFVDEPAPPTLDGAIVAAFLREFYAVTEGAPPDRDPELAAVLATVPAAVPLCALGHPSAGPGPADAG